MEHKKESHKVFYSWQSGNRTARNKIYKALDKAKEQLQEEGIRIEITQDTNGRVGTQNIDSEVLQKIRDCNIFVADVTPIQTIKEEDEETGIKQSKLIPNPNVMYESGYALAHKGMNRILFMAALEAGQEINQLPFDINHITIKTLGDGDISSYLITQFRLMIEEINAEQTQRGREYDCLVMSEDNQSYSGEITIHPIYQKRVYVPSRHIQPAKPAKANISHIVGGMPLDMMLAALENKQVTTIKPSEVYVSAPKECINHSACPIDLRVYNPGLRALENVNVYVQIETPDVIFTKENKERTNGVIASLLNRPNYWLTENLLSCNVKVLNSGDLHDVDSVYVVVPYGVEEITLRWWISAKEIPSNRAPHGLLNIHVEPSVVKEEDEVINDKKAYTEEMIPYMEEVKLTCRE